MEPQHKQSIQVSTDKCHEDQIMIENPMESYDDELMGQLVHYEKKNIDSEDHKSRGLKRKEKLEKIRADLKDPELRRQRNRERHRKQKQKLQKNLQGLTEEQIKQYLTKRKQAKNQLKDKVKKDVESEIGLPFLIDIAYEHKMSEKENKSLATQIQLIVKTLKTIDPAPNVHLCGLKEGSQVKDQLIKMNYEYWPIKAYEERLQECLKTQKFKNKNVYYLSPDAKKTINNIEENDVFVIGGLVDRTVIKYASLNRAQQLGIEARSLPIRPFMKQRSCLNLDHIVAIMCKFVEVKDWKLAFDHGAPKRWKRGEGQNGLRQPKDQQSSENEGSINEKNGINDQQAPQIVKNQDQLK